jgi:hypothetical protein
VVIKEAALDFGLVQIGTNSASFITVENLSNLPLKWNLKCFEHEDYFEFRKEGQLKPLEIEKIPVLFNPTNEIILKTQFELTVEDGNIV